MLRAAKPAAIKVKAAEELQEVMENAKTILLTDFTGMSVAEFDELRLKCFQNQIQFRIAKNRIVKLVLERLGHIGVSEFLSGPTGFCMGFDDPILPVRIISDFAKAKNRPVIKGCLMDGTLYGAEDANKLKDIPPREVLLAMVVGGIAAPLSGFVFVLNEILRSFAAVVDAIAVKLESDTAEREGISATGGSVQKIIEAIEKMTVLELVELKKALEEKFGVTAAAPMAVAGGIAAAPDAAEEEEEQTEFTVLLTAAGDKKIQVIKEVRAITSLGLKEAKALVDEAPKPIKESVTKEEAMAIKAKIEEAGGQVELK